MHYLRFPRLFRLYEGCSMDDPSELFVLPPVAPKQTLDQKEHLLKV